MKSQLSNLEAMDRYRTLGPDFLTWIYRRAAEENLPAPPSEPGLKVAILGPIVLEGEEGDATRVSLAGESAAAAPELRAALKQGKRMARMKLQFEAGPDIWLFSLDAATFDVRGAKLPVPKLSDADEYLAQRIQALQRLHLLIAELFEAFLRVRLDPASWAAEGKGKGKGQKAK